MKLGEDQPFGLSNHAITQLTNNSKKQWTFEQLSNVKFGILTFLYSDLFPSNKKMPHFIVASCASSHELVDKGEGGLKRFKFDLEDPTVTRLVFVFHLSLPSRTSPLVGVCLFVCFLVDPRIIYSVPRNANRKGPQFET